MACVTKSALDHIADSDLIVIESNYDPAMLEQSAGQPGSSVEFVTTAPFKRPVR